MSYVQNASGLFVPPEYSDVDDDVLELDDEGLDSLDELMHDCGEDTCAFEDFLCCRHSDDPCEECTMP